MPVVLFSFFGHESPQVSFCSFHFSFLFGDFPDTEVKSAVENAFNAALVTKCEQEVFGTYYDNKDKTARCKRLIVQIQDDTHGHIWNKLYKVVHALVELATKAKAKKAKVD